MISMRGRSAGNGLRLPRRLAGETAFRGFVDGLYFVFCLVERHHLRRRRIDCLLGLSAKQSLAQQGNCSSRKPTLDCIFASICLSTLGSLGRFSGMGFMLWIIPNQATNRGVKT